MIEKVNLKMIFFETLSLIFLINGIQRLYVSSQGKKYDAIFTKNYDEYYSLTSKTLGDFLSERTYWTVGAFFVLILIIGILNRMNRIPFINTSIIFLIVFLIFLTGFFVEGLVNDYLNYFSGMFGDSYGIPFLIVGMVLTSLGIVILWTSLKYYNKKY